MARLSEDQIREKYDELIDIGATNTADLRTDLFDVDHDRWSAIDLARYIVWLGCNGPNEISGDNLAIFTLAYLHWGMFPSEVAEDLGLPIPPAWA